VGDEYIILNPGRNKPNVLLKKFGIINRAAVLYRYIDSLLHGLCGV